MTFIAGGNTDVLKKAKESLMMRFKMKDLGVLSWFLHCKNRPVMVTVLKGYNQLQKVILT